LKIPSTRKCGGVNLFLSLILFTFLAISGGVVYFIRQNNIFSQNIEEFEILDE